MRLSVFLGVPALVLASLLIGSCSAQCSLNLDLTFTTFPAVPQMSSCTNISLSAEVCLAAVRLAYGGLNAMPGDAAAVVNQGIMNLQCLVERFFETGMVNFTGYFQQLCRIADYERNCFGAVNTACSGSMSGNSDFKKFFATIFGQDPLMNIANMVCTGATLNTDVQNVLTTNKLGTCLTPDMKMVLYKRFDDLRNALGNVSVGPMQQFSTGPPVNNAMVRGLCGAFGGALRLVNLLSLNATNCDLNTFRALAFLFSSMRPAFCGQIGQNDTYASFGAQSMTDRVAQASNTTNVGCYGASHFRTFVDTTNGLVTCGQNNNTAYTTLLRLPFTLIEGLLIPFNTSTNYSYLSEVRVSFFNKTYGFVDSVKFKGGATAIVTLTETGKSSLKYSDWNLNQDILIQADSTSSVCTLIIDKNGRTFIRVCIFTSTAGKVTTMYYLGVNTLTDYMANFAMGLLRDSCPQAQDISAFNHARRRRRDTSSTASNMDVSATNDASASTMTSSESSMNSSLSNAATTYGSGSGAFRVVAPGFFTTVFASLLFAWCAGALLPRVTTQDN